MVNMFFIANILLHILAINNVNFYICEGLKTNQIVLKWAPLVYLSPGEVFFPSSVNYFLNHVQPINPNLTPSLKSLNLPLRMGSESWYLATKENIDNLLENNSSFIHGENPSASSVPVYVSIVVCPTMHNKSITNHSVIVNPLHFYVTYWMFYPYSKGKSVCTWDMGRLGTWPIPKVNNLCWGALRDFGSHVGDWEHFSLYFKNSYFPDEMYVSAHDVGAIYKYSKENNEFIYDRYHIRKGLLQRPTFPRKVKLLSRTHPVLFSSAGSHGLWAAPGRHKFTRMARLYDETGYGNPWKTWRKIIFLNESTNDWLKFYGRWGNPRSGCHPVSKFGVNLCEFVDGPTGIPMKRSYFQCSY